METSDERREVAEALRYISRDELGSGGLLSTWKRVLGVNGTWRDVMSRLANLIDPTCHNVSHVGSQLKTAGPFVCSRCGCWVPERWVMDDFESRHTAPISYCPNCRARCLK